MSREKTPGVEGPPCPGEEGLPRVCREARVPRQQAPETMDSKQGLSRWEQRTPAHSPLCSNRAPFLAGHLAAQRPHFPAPCSSAWAVTPCGQCGGSRSD